MQSIYPWRREPNIHGNLRKQLSWFTPKRGVCNRNKLLQTPCNTEDAVKVVIQEGEKSWKIRWVFHSAFRCVINDEKTLISVWYYDYKLSFPWFFIQFLGWMMRANVHRSELKWRSTQKRDFLLSVILNILISLKNNFTRVRLPGIFEFFLKF